MKISEELLQILACPRCKGKLEMREQESVLACPACRLAYPVREGIPILLTDEARPL